MPSVFRYQVTGNAFRRSMSFACLTKAHEGAMLIVMGGVDGLIWSEGAQNGKTREKSIKHDNKIPSGTP
jgi:hypothetical protein